MVEPFLGEIRMFAGSFAPPGWALCDGQLLSVVDFEALFSLLGTIYGGDGRSTFALPDLRGRLPVHAGSGPGLSTRRLGLSSGAETVIVNTNQLPSHTHALSSSTDLANEETPARNVTGQTETMLYGAETPLANMDENILGDVGGDQDHNNLMPYLCINFIISLSGIYPSRE